MRDLIKKIFKRNQNSKTTPATTRTNDISDTTSAVFEKYKKSFKDLARYDREGKVGVN
jgi:SepF-like predicted cell division protein (DUF552 family)